MTAIFQTINPNFPSDMIQSCTTDLTQKTYDFLKDFIPTALKALTKAINQTGLNQLKIADMPSLTIGADTIKLLQTEVQTLTTLFQKTLSFKPTGCLAFFKKFFTWLFYAKPVQKQIDKITQATQNLDLGLKAQRQTLVKAWENDFKACTRSIGALNQEMAEFKQKVCSYEEVIFPSSFIDKFTTIDSKGLPLLKQFDALEKTGRELSIDPQILDKIGDLRVQIYNLSADFGYFYNAMTLFQKLHYGIQYRNLDILATGTEVAPQKKTVSKQDIEKALKYSFAWDKLHEFADFQLRQILSGDVDRQLQAYIKKLKFLTEVIPQLRSRLITEANVLATMLSVNEDPEAAPETVPPPAVKAAVPLYKQKTLFERFFS